MAAVVTLNRNRPAEKLRTEDLLFEEEEREQSWRRSNRLIIDGGMDGQNRKPPCRSMQASLASW
jgi:hypothetical protein